MSTPSDSVFRGNAGRSQAGRQPATEDQLCQTASSISMVIEWHNPFTQHNNRGLLFYRVTVLPEVKPEDFEAFVKTKYFQL